jgi:hypothetical protein
LTRTIIRTVSQDSELPSDLLICQIYIIDTDTLGKELWRMFCACCNLARQFMRVYLGVRMGSDVDPLIMIQLLSLSPLPRHSQATSFVSKQSNEMHVTASTR